MRIPGERHRPPRALSLCTYSETRLRFRVSFFNTKLPYCDAMGKSFEAVVKLLTLE